MTHVNEMQSKQFDFKSLVEETILDVTGFESVSTPEEAYKLFALKVGTRVNDLVAQALAEVISQTLNNKTLKVEVNGVNWLNEFLVGKPISMHYYWPTPGFNAPISLQNHISQATSQPVAEGEVGTKGGSVSIGISGTFSF